MNARDEWPRRVDLSQACVLLTNDDGVSAPGMAALEAAIRPLARRTVTVAPDGNRSGAGHAITGFEPIAVSGTPHRDRWAISGTPADAAMIGLQHVLRDDPPDLVISGVNRGANVGDDYYASGTIGAAIQACLQDVPALSVSAAYARPDQVDRTGSGPHWDMVRQALPNLVRDLCAHGWARDVFYNINLPNLAYPDILGVRAARQGRIDGAPSFYVQPSVEVQEPESGSERVGLAHAWPDRARGVDNEYALLKAGYICVTPVRVEITHAEGLSALAAAMNKDLRDA